MPAAKNGIEHVAKMPRPGALVIAPQPQRERVLRLTRQMSAAEPGESHVAGDRERKRVRQIAWARGFHSSWPSPRKVLLAYVPTVGPQSVRTLYRAADRDRGSARGTAQRGCRAEHHPLQDADALRCE